VKHCLPKVSKATRWSTFKRQLNMYNFRRARRVGENNGEFSHPYFKRDGLQLGLLRRRKREGKKYSKKKSKATPQPQNHHSKKKVDVKAKVASTTSTASQRIVPATLFGTKTVFPALPEVSYKVAFGFAWTILCPRGRERYPPPSSPMLAPLSPTSTHSAGVVSLHEACMML
jgi:hypothetical protein